VSTPPRHHTAVRKSGPQSIDRAAMTVRCLVTFPERDRQGDFVQPDGIRWVARPKIDWEHGAPIGWAGIEYTTLDHAGRVWSVPVGTSHFARRPADLDGIDLTEYDRAGRAVGRYDPRECLLDAEQVWELVTLDKASGVSVEFLPDPAHTRVVGKSRHPQTGRFPSDYLRCQGLGFAHCVEPVSFNARVLKSLSAADDALLVIAQTGRIAGSPLRPTIAKSLSRYLEIAKARPAAVRVEKAMPDPMDPNAAEPLPLPEPDADPGVDGPTAPRGRPSVEVGLDVAQGIKDLIAAAEEKLGTSDDPKAIADYRKLNADAEALAEDYAALSAKKEAKLKGVDGGAEPEDVEPEGEPDADPEPLETDDDGALKTKSLYKASRLSFDGRGRPTFYRLVKGRGLVPIADDGADLSRTLARLDRRTRRLERDQRQTRDTYR
jgi:hypothetical protein